MQRILVLKPEGRFGQNDDSDQISPLTRARETSAIVDNDPQGSSARWLKKRTRSSPPSTARGLRPEQPHDPGLADAHSPDVTHVVVDTPAAVSAQDMPEMTRGATPSSYRSSRRTSTFTPSRNASPTCC